MGEIRRGETEMVTAEKAVPAKASGEIDAANSSPT
jgi:hypothetical protein